ncbi:MAG: NAD-dependent epimerase/dehydratase family protein [Nannocystis sp.]|jgi:UDP-glucose 4-epimerase|nr:NAD-dependent epimerase/dehydratase family protein [Nannocystis sp.]
MKVLITGISGAHARLVAERLVLRGHQVIGVDRRPWPAPPPGIRVYQADVRKRPAADVFRSERPDAVIHMATITHFSGSREERLRINLQGTRVVFEHCHEFGVKQAIFVGRHTIYGATADAPLYRDEYEPPLAVTTFPELADLVAADLYAGTALWRWPELCTSVLRLVYLLGPTRRGTLASFLAGPRVPMILGFDPLFQFMHDHDAADAVVLALEHRIAGVYNVAGPPPVPLSVLCRGTGRRALALPEPLFTHLSGHFGLPSLPPGAISHIKHPIVVDAATFRAKTGFTHRHDAHAVMSSFRDG